VKIAIATPASGFQGGLERYAHAYASTLRALGHELTLLHGPAEGRDPAGFRSAFDRVGTPSDRQLVRDQDVIYVQRARSIDDLAPFEDRPVVIAAHDHDHTCVRSHRYLPTDRSPCHRAPGVGCALRGCTLVRRREGFPLALVDPLALRRSTQRLASRATFVACSRYVSDRLVDAGVPASRVRVLHPVLPAVGAPLVPRPRAPRLLVMGQLLRGKGFDLAIDAVARLPGDHTLSIVGDGPSRAELEAHAARVAPERVRFSGYLPPEKVHEAYDAASVVLVPSRWPEPFGLIGVEAMQRGRPVVGVAHGGIPEWLDAPESGVLVPPLDVAALARAASELARDEAAGERALVSAERFDHRRAAEQLVRMLDDAAGRSGFGALVA
jgi:glycosyltransferase involved in cell wall biosynthesis